MAVTTTVLDILVAAYARSIKNKPGTLATQETELLDLVIRLFRGYYALAAGINKTYFAGFADVDVAAESGGPLDKGWPRPQEAEVIFRMERLHQTTGGQGGEGDEVVVVPFDDRGAEKGVGAVFRIGQTFFPAGNAKDPTGGLLRMYFTRRPDDPATVDDVLDQQWPEQFNNLPIVDVAIYLAAKDGRADELGQLQQERVEWLTQFTNFLMHPETNVRGRMAAVERVRSPALAPATPG